MPEKPIPPQIEKTGVLPFVTAIILAIITSFFIVSYSKAIKERELYNSYISMYNQAVVNHGNEVSKYNSDILSYIHYSEILSYIHSIDPSYDIDINGTIPVVAMVKYQKDPKSQYIGDETSYYFSINNNSITREKEFRLSIFHEVIFDTKIIENDPSSDDVGREKVSVPLSFLELNDEYILKQVVNVRERYGMNAGHVAIYNVTYSIKPKQALVLTSSQKASFPKYPILRSEPKRSDYSIGFWDAIKNYSDVKLYISIAFIFWLLSSYFILIHRPRVEYQHALDKYNRAYEEYTAARNALLQKLSKNTIRELAGVPDYIFFTSDNLPYTKGDDQKYGAFTIYITPSGNRYHRVKTCSKTASPIHMYKVSQRYTPCSLCAKGFTIQKPTWYSDYLGLIEKCKHFEITKSITYN